MVIIYSICISDTECILRLDIFDIIKLFPHNFDFHLKMSENDVFEIVERVKFKKRLIDGMALPLSARHRRRIIY